jgi:hypothetical protein
MSFRALFFLCLGVAFTLCGTGCASDDEKKDPDRISTIPWNRPEKWESQGPLGSMLPQNQ